jgi:uncharacterized protein (DUF433 family)
MVQKEYVTKLDYEFEGEPRIAYRIAGTRVSLDSVVLYWLQGESPESLVDSFPSLTLEQVFGALAFYLANREEIDKYLDQGRADFDKMSRQWKERLIETNPDLYQRLMAAKQRRVEPATAIIG